MDGMDYTRLPAMVQFAVGDVEAHNHLARVERASRMWRAIADELTALSDSLRRELDCLRESWPDATGVEFVRQATRRQAAVEETLARIVEHQPWLALDDLARQLLLTRARLTGTAEQATEGAEYEGAVHLTELDHYFLAAADAVLRAAGSDQRVAGIHAPTTGSRGDGCCTEAAVAEPTLAAAGPGALPSMTLAPGAGSPLPPGSLSIPGLVAVPPGSSAYGTPRGSAGSSGASPARAGGVFDPSTLAGGELDAGGTGPGAVSAGSLPDTTGPDLPPRIEQAAKPVSLSGPPSAPEAPQPPAAPAPGSAGPSAGSGSGRMIPPMMMMPMAPGAGRTAGKRNGPARSLDDSERTSKRPAGAPGVPARLRGRSALADPAAGGFRPIAMSSTKRGMPEPAEQVLDREVWQVANPGAASPLKPDPVEEPPMRRRRRH
ncbi:hypothetical protein ABZ863_09290 [Saccharomonospora sp. NPDC046836]|uniref:hypothetical protein n=1 Tax=Saccharomonospora sp. NPDC046836 TaxID=3156921 RepID=UPI0033DD0A19